MTTLLNVIIGTPMVDTSTGEVFKVLCSCPGSRPVHHTKRFIDSHRDRYRVPTVQELETAPWVSKT